MIFFIEYGSFSHVVEVSMDFRNWKKKFWWMEPTDDWNLLYNFLLVFYIPPENWRVYFQQELQQIRLNWINAYWKRIKTVTILRLWWTPFWLYIQYFDIKVQTKVTLFWSRILWSKLPVISMCWDLLDNLYLYSRNPWKGFSFIKSTEESLIIWESGKLAKRFWTARKICLQKL